MDETDLIARAFVTRGAASNWPPENRPPTYSIGFTLGASSWPRWPGFDPKATKGQTITVWRNPDTSNGDLWYQPGRFGTIAEWQPGRAPWHPIDFVRQLQQFGLDLAAVRRPLTLPFGPGWKGAGGQQGHAVDNGLIIDTTRDGTRGVEVQGLAPLSVLDVLGINARALAPVAALGHYRCDAVRLFAPDIVPHGSQGPYRKVDGLMAPADLAGPWDGPRRLVGFNVQFGPNARAIPPGWVEHPEPRQPNPGHPVVLPMGDHPDMIPCNVTLRLDITDEAIDRWLTAEKIPPSSTLAVSKRWFAIGLRDHGMVIRERGTGEPTIESTGGINPTEAKRWAARGVTSERVANELGRNLFRYGRLYTAAP